MVKAERDRQGIHKHNGRLDQSDMRSQRPGICRDGPRGVVETLEGGHQGDLVGGGRQPLRYQGGYGLSDTLDVGTVLVHRSIGPAGQGDRRAGGGAWRDGPGFRQQEGAVITNMTGWGKIRVVVENAYEGEIGWVYIRHAQARGKIQPMRGDIRIVAQIAPAQKMLGGQGYDLHRAHEVGNRGRVVDIFEEFGAKLGRRQAVFAGEGTGEGLLALVTGSECNIQNGFVGATKQDGRAIEAFGTGIGQWCQTGIFPKNTIQSKQAQSYRFGQLLEVRPVVTILLNVPPESLQCRYELHRIAHATRADFRTHFMESLVQVSNQFAHPQTPRVVTL